MDSKLKCVFDVPVDGKDPGARSNSTLINPQTPASPSINNATIAEEVTVEKGDDMKKLIEDNKRLREELASIRAENLQLKEDGLKHRIRSGISSSISGDKLMHSEPSSQKLAANPSLALSPQLIGIAVLLLIAGIVLGKVLF